MVMSVPLMLTVLVVFRLKRGLRGMVMGVTARLAPVGVAHDFLLLAEALRSRRGHFAWAQRHTLMAIVRRSQAQVKRERASPPIARQSTSFAKSL
jgi:hypothetical protein